MKDDRTKDNVIEDDVEGEDHASNVAHIATQKTATDEAHDDQQKDEPTRNDSDDQEMVDAATLHGRGGEEGGDFILDDKDKSENDEILQQEDEEALDLGDGTTRTSDNQEKEEEDSDSEVKYGLLGIDEDGLPDCPMFLQKMSFIALFHERESCVISDKGVKARQYVDAIVFGKGLLKQYHVISTPASCFNQLFLSLSHLQRC